jgi:hypothetical protein
MAILGRFTKQPTEVLDYDVDFSEWFADRTDTLGSFTVSATAGITVVSSSNIGNVVKVVLSGGTNGTKYQVTVRVTTTPNAYVREADFVVTVKET